MRIRSKIAILYTQLTFMVLLGAFAVAYVLTVRDGERRFYDQLWDRAMVSVQYHFEQDEMPESAYQSVADSYKFALNRESDRVFDADDPHILDSLRTVVPAERDARLLLQGRTVEFRRGEMQCLGVYYPDNAGNFVVIISAYDRHGADSRHNLLRLLTVILFVSTVLVYLIGQLYARKVMAPVADIIRNVRNITANNLKRSLREERGNDELSELSRTFNDMIGRLREAFDMQNSFIRNASHELRNPLTAILGATEIALSKRREPEEYVGTLETVLAETERLNSMIRDLFMLAQTDFGFSRVRKRTVDVGRLLEGAAAEVERTAPDGGAVVFGPGAEGPHTVHGVDTLLKIAFINLLGNARKFSDGKPVTIAFRREGTRLCIDIRDEGIGIPPGEIRKIFQPFYRGANTGNYRGTGIGLSLSARIVDLHGGRLSVVSELGKGTTVTVIMYDK